MNKFILVLKGFVVGATMLVPGVSGGSMAMILGIYDELIQSITSFIKKKSMITLGLFCIGSIGGIILFSYPMLYFINHYYLYMMYFFLGCVISSISFIKKKSEITYFKMKDYIYILLGIVFVLLINSMPLLSLKDNHFVMIVAGFVLAIALVLPGISVSYVMVLFGIYEPVMHMIQSYDVMGLLPLLIGGVLGVFLLSSFLEYMLTHHKEATYMVIFGFVLGSLIEIFPGIPGLSQIGGCLLLFVAGYFAIHYLSKIEE